MSQLPVPILAFAPLQWTAMPGTSKRVLTHLARTRSVFVLEAPQLIETGDREYWELSPGTRDLLVCRPRVASLSTFGSTRRQARMVRALLYWLDIGQFVAWVYEQSAPSYLESLTPTLRIHDRSLDWQRTRATAKRLTTANAALATAEASGA